MSQRKTAPKNATLSPFVGCAVCAALIGARPVFSGFPLTPQHCSRQPATSISLTRDLVTGNCLNLSTSCWRIKDQLDVTCILFHFLCAQHVSYTNISIIRSLRLCCWITTLVVIFLVRCVLEIRCGWVEVVPVLLASSLQHTLNSQQIKKKYSNITFHENPSSESRVVPCGQTDGWTRWS